MKRFLWNFPNKQRIFQKNLWILKKLKNLKNNLNPIKTIINFQQTVNKKVKFIEDKSEIEILAIGIGHDVSRYYKRAIKITDVNELGDVMISQLSSLFDKKVKLH